MVKPVQTPEFTSMMKFRYQDKEHPVLWSINRERTEKVDKRKMGQRVDRDYQHAHLDTTKSIDNKLQLRATYSICIPNNSNSS